MKRQRHRDRVEGINRRIRERGRQPRTIILPSGMMMTTGSYLDSLSAEERADLCNPLKNAQVAARLYREKKDEVGAHGG